MVTIPAIAIPIIITVIWIVLLVLVGNEAGYGAGVDMLFFGFGGFGVVMASWFLWALFR